MKITQFWIPGGNYLRTMGGIFDAFAITVSIAITTLIAMAVAQIPQAGNLWLALAVSTSAIVASALHLRSGLKYKRRDKPLGGARTSL
jgi:hypothetical protein